MLKKLLGMVVVGAGFVACSSAGGGGGGGGFDGGGAGGFGAFGATGGDSGALGGTGGFGATGGTGAVGGFGATGGTGATGGFGATGATGGFGATGGTGGGSSLMFGSACASAVQCGGLTCLTPSSGALDGGGPAKGLCTAACASDFDCQGLGSNAVCLEYSTGVGFCFEGCSFGNPGNTFLPSKCHGRPEMACSPLSDGVSLVGQACLPQCNSDADCGTLHCDPKSGLCRATPATGKDLGAECVQQDGGPGECKGNCTGIVNPGSSVPFTYTCTERCTLGAPAQCGWDGTSQAPGFCLFSSTLISTPGIGDQGSCAQLCSCNADCKNPSFVCRAFNDPNFEATLGQKGYCGSSSIQGGGVDPGIPVCN